VVADGTKTVSTTDRLLTLPNGDPSITVLDTPAVPGDTTESSPGAAVSVDHPDRNVESRVLDINPADDDPLARIISLLEAQALALPPCQGVENKRVLAIDHGVPQRGFFHRDRWYVTFEVLCEYEGDFPERVDMGSCYKIITKRERRQVLYPMTREVNEEERLQLSQR